MGVFYTNKKLIILNMYAVVAFSKCFDAINESSSYNDSIYFHETIQEENELWFSRDYILNVTRNVILATESDSSYFYTLMDVKTSIQKYFSNEMIPSVVLDTKSLLSLSSSKKHNGTKLQKVMFFIAFETIRSLDESLDKNDWLHFYKKFNTKYFLFVIANNDIEVTCFPEEDYSILKEHSGSFFASIWKLAKIIETLIIVPNVCNKQIILKYDFIQTHISFMHSEGISVIYKEDITKNGYEYLLHNYHDFNKYPLNINVFHRVPSLVEKEMAKSFSDTYLDQDISPIGHLAGFDGFTMSNLVKALNFQPIINIPTYKDKFGHLENNTFTGSLGDIVYKTMDISFNSRFIKDYKTDALEFTAPIFSDDFCVITPKAQRIPQSMYIFLIFDKITWTLIGLCVFSSGIVWWLMQTKMVENVENKKPFYVYYMDICLLFISNPTVLPKNFQERLFIVMCLIFNLIVAGLFQGQLSTAHSIISYYPDIKTLSELDKSGYKIGTSVDDIFGVNISNVGDRLSKKIIRGHKGIQGVAMDRNFSCLERKADAKLVFERNFTNKYGEHLLHLVEDCPRSYHLAYIVYRGFPLLKYIDTFLVHCVEAGLINQWYEFTEFSVLLPTRLQREANQQTDKRISFPDVQISFIILGIGVLMSIAVLISELVIVKWIKYKQHRRPLLIDANVNPVVIYMSYCERLDRSRF